MIPKNRPPVHPGEILKEEYLKPLHLSQQKLAKDLGINRVRVNEIVRCKRSITPDMAFRLAKYFNTTPDFWLNLQKNFDMWHVLKTHKEEYEKIRSIA